MIKQENEITEYIQRAFESHFYEEPLSQAWRFAAVRALDFTSPLGLGITPQEMRQIREKLIDDGPLNWLQYATVSNNLQARTREELNMAVGLYYELMEATAIQADAFNEMTKPVYDKAVGDAVSAGRNGKQVMMPMAPTGQA